MDAEPLLTGQAESVFANEGDGERLADHGLLPTGPVHKLVLGLRESTQAFLNKFLK